VVNQWSKNLGAIFIMFELLSTFDELFFDKGNILVLRRYQLHPISATTQYHKDITDAYSQKTKRKRRKKKDPATVINSL
jgi:hypothetical protein